MLNLYFFKSLFILTSPIQHSEPVQRKLNAGASDGDSTPPEVENKIAVISRSGGLRVMEESFNQSADWLASCCWFL